MQAMQVKIWPVTEMMGINKHVDEVEVQSMQFAAYLISECWCLEWAEKYEWTLLLDLLSLKYVLYVGGKKNPRVASLYLSDHVRMSIYNGRICVHLCNTCSLS